MDLVTLTGKDQAQLNRHVMCVMPSTPTRETSSGGFGWLFCFVS